MRRFILLILVLTALAVGLLFGHALMGEKGYVLISFGQTTIEMTVISAIISAVLLIVCFKALEWLLTRSFRVFSGSRKWFGRLSLRKQRNSLHQAINALCLGDYGEAKRCIEKTFGGDFGGSNYILAAQIHSKQGEHAKAIAMLELAETYTQSETAAKIPKAQWLLRQGNTENCLNILASLPKKATQNKIVANLWLEALSRAGDFETLRDKLAHFKGVLGTEYITWAQTSFARELAEIASKEGANAVKQRWLNLSRAAKKDEANQIAYFNTLIDQGLSKDAEYALVELHQKHLPTSLYDTVKRISHPQPLKLIALLERNIKREPNAPEAYSLLAHLAFNSGDMVLAERALGKAVELSPDEANLLLQAQILEHKSAHSDANALYKRLLSH